LLPLTPQSRLKKAVEDFVSDSFSAVLRRDYLELINSLAAGVEGKVKRCAATLIAYYRHWQEWKQEHQRTDWVYQPLRQLYKDLMGLFSMPVIRAANDLLIDLGLLERRGNPGNGQDKTYQYNVRFDRVKQLLTESRAASPFEKIDVSSGRPEVSASPANTHHQVKSTQVKSTNQNSIWNEGKEGSQEGILTTQIERPTTNEEREEVRRLIAESLAEELGSEATSLINDAAINSLSSLDNDVAIDREPERKEFDRSSRLVHIPGLDESGHEILHSHQAALLKLNVDLRAPHLQQAIVDNPQHLESAILAFFVASARGPLAPKQATGFLYNALRSGWKPKPSPATSSQLTPDCYTPHPLMVEKPKPTTLEELVKRKRHLWQVAPIMRNSIKVWAEETPGVVSGPDGPELAVEGASATSSTEPVATLAHEPVAPHQNSVPTLSEASRTGLAEPTELVTPLAVDSAASTPTPAAPKVSAPSPNELQADPLMATPAQAVNAVATPTATADPLAAADPMANAQTSTVTSEASAHTLADPEADAPNPEPDRRTPSVNPPAAKADLSASSPPSAAPGAVALASTPARMAKPPGPWYAERLKPREDSPRPSMAASASSTRAGSTELPYLATRAPS